jgi:predicted small lipoprotein YifL
MSARTTIMLLSILSAGALAGCGQKGPLYLPDKASEIVTRPAQTPPPPENSGATSSPQTVDSPAAPPSPAPEPAAPESDKDKKKQDAATPPR